MGHYTGLRVRGQLKPEFVPVVWFILANPCEFRAQDEIPWIRAAMEFPILAESAGYLKFSTKERANCIPGLFTSVDAWEEDDPEWETRVENDYFVLESIIKNYNEELETFVEHVVPLFFASVDHCEIADEGMHAEGALYALEDGKMVQKAKPLPMYPEDRNGFWLVGPDPEPELPRWQSPWQLSKDSG